MVMRMNMLTMIAEDNGVADELLHDEENGNEELGQACTPFLRTQQAQALLCFIGR